MAENYELELYSSCHEGRAKVNDTISFFAVLRCNSNPVRTGKVRYQLWGNLQKVLAQGELDLSIYGVNFRYAAPEPVYLKCRIEWEHNGLLLADELGVVVAPEKIRPSFEIPKDFDTFWQRQLTRLAAVPLNLRCIPLPSGEGLQAFSLRADAVQSEITGELLRPAAAGRYPAILLPQCGGVRSTGLGHASYWAARGFLALDLNPHGCENNRDHTFYEELGAGSLRGYERRNFETGDPEQCYMMYMMLRVRRALDCLCAMPEWDGKNLILSGGSQGAWQSIAGAYLEPRVSAVVAWIPAGADIFSGGWPYHADNAPCMQPNAETLRKSIPYVDAVSFASRITAPTLIAAGLADNTCKADGVMALYNVCSAPDKELHLHTRVFHRTYQTVFEELDEFVARHLQAES